MEKVLGPAVVAVLLSVGLVAPVSAHSGGTDANGCHAASHPYHCHGGSTTPAPASAPAPAPSGDRNCADFTSREEAEAFFVSEGGPSSDPHGRTPTATALPVRPSPVARR